ncbi:hypothetical protein ACE1TI_03035 [Alteribacillus sp. JSM 102045]|uniref:hypothetical protein n=1 Tax=Alteribacillus sp. JSM 102045 TaxID=1562101 RepID=UPI0035C14E02
MYTFNPEVKLLLVNESNEKVEVTYSPYSFELPKIGPRPPYYVYPNYEAYYPII